MINEKELEEWIEQNNLFLANKSTAEILKNHPMSLAWTAGAKSMAEHLQSQPPTKEQVLKVLRIYFLKDDVQSLLERDFTCVNEYVEQCVEQILKHWDDEKETQKEK